MVASIVTDDAQVHDMATTAAVVRDMLKIEEAERENREQQEATAAAAIAWKQSVATKESAAETASKLAKLDNLLEKAGIYSSFLFSNMATAAIATPVHTEEHEDVEEENEETPTGNTNKRKRKRTGSRTVKKDRNAGAKKLKELQNDTAVDTRQQPRVHFQQPKLLTGGKLRAYQLEGIRWLCNLFENGLNGILADEMGLGKTIQVIGLIAHLKALGVRGPYLITAPLSTLMNWYNEFQKWAPSIPVMIYHGNKTTRRAMRQKELNRSKQHDVDFPVVITSYEMILQDSKSFTSAGFVWKYVIIDEGHRLKNMNCLLVRELKRARSENRLLLTGTPLQNNLTELWSLLNYILPDVFDDLEMFESWFSFTPDAGIRADSPVQAQDVLVGEKRAEVVSKLHEILRPFLLRRLKIDVIDEMPSKTEIFVYCPMSPLQREYYTLILDRQLEAAMAAKYGKFRAAAFKTNNLKNRCMQLRKCCNHPYLFDEPTDASGDLITNEDIITSAGKMVVLDQMLKALQRKGHKVLIFSQMTRILDILQDFMDFRGYTYCRLDGSTSLQARQEQMNAFNKTKAGENSLNDDDNVFCFLLSTRAGGLGINLISADTVIFYDSDWNPQQDNQAQDRCHRIGQTKEIVVYRLVTENSFENRMITRAIEKRKLERVVIQRGHFKQHNEAQSGAIKALTNEELEDLLRDDVLVRNGVESGGITKEELAKIMDRELVVKSFVTSSEDEKKAVAAHGLLEVKGHGYEVVENAPVAVMESFA